MVHLDFFLNGWLIPQNNSLSKNRELGSGAKQQHKLKTDKHGQPYRLNTGGHEQPLRLKTGGH